MIFRIFSVRTISLSIIFLLGVFAAGMFWSLANIGGFADCFVAK